MPAASVRETHRWCVVPEFHVCVARKIAEHTRALAPRCGRNAGNGRLPRCRRARDAALASNKAFRANVCVKVWVCSAHGEQKKNPLRWRCCRSTGAWAGAGDESNEQARQSQTASTLSMLCSAAPAPRPSSLLSVNPSLDLLECGRP